MEDCFNILASYLDIRERVNLAKTSKFFSSLNNSYFGFLKPRYKDIERCFFCGASTKTIIQYSSTACCGVCMVKYKDDIMELGLMRY